MRINAKVFWQNVRRLREEQGLKQTEVANAIGINPSYYSNLERGIQKTLNAKIASAIAKHLGTTVESLLEGEEDSTSRFWQNVKSKRILLGVTHETMAAALGITATYYGYKETAMPSKIRVKDAEAIANALHTTVADLMGRKDIIWDKLSDDVKDMLSTDTGRKLVEELAKQFKEDREANSHKTSP